MDMNVYGTTMLQTSADLTTGTSSSTLCSRPTALTLVSRLTCLHGHLFSRANELLQITSE